MTVEGRKKQRVMGRLFEFMETTGAIFTLQRDERDLTWYSSAWWNSEHPGCRPSQSAAHGVGDTATTAVKNLLAEAGYGS